MKGLFAQAALRFGVGVLLSALLLFLPAGTWAYWKAWLLMGVLFVPMLGAGIVLLLRKPDLLEKRLRSKEHQPAQRAVVGLSGLMFLAGFVLAGLTRRFGWIPLPGWISWAAAGILLLGYLLYAEVLRENAWLSRTVEVQENQKLIDTGLYAIVRHPMYSATILLFLSMPLVLGSLLSFLLFLPYPFLLVKRIENEEQVLMEGLAGYGEYRKRVKYRLFPFIW